MRPSAQVHEALARLVEYPRDGFAACVEAAAGCVSDACPPAWEHLAGFVAFARAQPVSELEELFTRTFDNTKDCALEIGWHVFGENYTRGTFMVSMRRRLRQAGLEENGELPDHLSHLLPLLGREEQVWAANLALDSVAPAMKKVHAALRQQGNPWADVIAAVLAVLAMHERPARAGARRLLFDEPVGARMDAADPCTHADGSDACLPFGVSLPPAPSPHQERNDA